MLNDVESWDTRNLLQDLVRRDQLIMKRLDSSLQQAIRSNPNYEPYLASCQGIYWSWNILWFLKLTFSTTNTVTWSSRNVWSWLFSNIINNPFYLIPKPVHVLVTAPPNEYWRIICCWKTSRNRRRTSRSRSRENIDPNFICFWNRFKNFAKNNTFGPVGDAFDPMANDKCENESNWTRGNIKFSSGIFFFHIFWEFLRCFFLIFFFEKFCENRKKLLIIIRLWSHLMSSCSPQFTKKDSTLDVLAELFRLLTSLWVSSTQEQEQLEFFSIYRGSHIWASKYMNFNLEKEPDKEILESCSKLQGRVYVQQPNLELPKR